MTKCYGLLRDGQIIHTAWTQGGLLLKAGSLSPFEIVEIDVPPVIEAVKWYFEQRGLVYAVDATQALMFLNSEVDELNDAVVHGLGEWVRNNERERDPGQELADILMMTIVTAERLGTDPLEEMFAKFAKKGYPIHE